MVRVKGPNRDQLTRRGDEFADLVTRAIAGILKMVASNVGDVDDLAVIKTHWSRAVEETLLDYVGNVWYESADDMYAQLVKAAQRVDMARPQHLIAALRRLQPSHPMALTSAITIPRVVNELAELFLEGARNRLAGIGDHVWTVAREQMLEGMKAGEGITEIRDRIVASTDISESRAQVIARTEVQGASNQGSYAQMKATGLPAIKEWIAANDSRTRESHVDVDGDERDIDEHFTVGGWPMDFPHDPAGPPEETISCRCTLGWEIEDEEFLELDAVAASAFHMPGKHDQDSHGHGGASKSGSLSKISSMLDAYEKGHTVDDVFSGGNSGVKVERLTLSDGSQVVRKSGKPLKNHGVRREYLGGRVYSAIAGDDVVTAQIDDDTIITTYVTGDTGGKLANKAYSFREDQRARVSKYNDEVQRQVELPGGKEIGMLDWLIDNPDRHDQNWMVNEDGTRPIDQGNANFVPTSYPDNKGIMREMAPASPFAAHWMGLRTTQFNEVRSIKPKFTKAELATTRAQIEELKSEFDQPGEAAWFDGMLGRLSQLEAKVKK